MGLWTSAWVCLFAHIVFSPSNISVLSFSGIWDLKLQRAQFAFLSFLPFSQHLLPTSLWSETFPRHNCSNWPAHHTPACSALSFYGSHPALPAFLQAVPLGHPLHVYWFSSNCVVRASIHPVLGLVLGKQGTIYPQPFLRTQIPSLWLIGSLTFLWWHCFSLVLASKFPVAWGRTVGLSVHLTIINGLAFVISWGTSWPWEPPDSISSLKGRPCLLLLTEKQEFSHRRPAEFPCHLIDTSNEERHWEGEYLALVRRGLVLALELACWKHVPPRHTPSSWIMLFHKSRQDLSASWSLRHVHSLLSHHFCTVFMLADFNFSLDDSWPSELLGLPSPRSTASLPRTLRQPTE